MRMRFLVSAAAVLLFYVAAEAQSPRTATVLEINGPIGPAASDYVRRNLLAAREAGAELVVLRMDTPGGLDSSMRAINSDILASAVPVVTYVAPSGARAASAGTYIAYASHVAAMAPGTNLGAATPVQIGGGSPFSPAPPQPDEKKDKGEAAKKDGADQPKARPATMSDKMVNDAVAYIRSLAQLRGRNVGWAEKAVREAASLSAEDALKEGVIDLIASDLDDLKRKLDGREVVVIGTARRLSTADLMFRFAEPDWRARMLAIITNPNVAYLLMLIGIYGLILEFFSPGAVLPGVVGAISLLLALYAFHILPVNYAGLALVFLGTAFMIGEHFLPSFGVLGIGGGVAFVIGSVMLLDMDIPGFRISPMLIGSIGALSAGFFALTMALLMRARRRPVVSGGEEMLGASGRVVRWEGGEGWVRVYGELWKAKANEPLSPGQRIRVKQMEGLTLMVQPDPQRS
jgi:membrane-bound serine protease (ClpP class)